MQVRFSELRGKEAYNGGGSPLGQIINTVVDPKTEEAFVVTMRASGRNIGSSVLPVGKLKLVDGNEIIFAINDIPAADFPPDYDSFLSDRQNPGAMNAQIYAMNKKKVLGVIFDYVLDTNDGKRAGILIEEMTIGQKRKFLVPIERATRSEERASGIKKILADQADLQLVR